MLGRSYAERCPPPRPLKGKPYAQRQCSMLNAISSHAAATSSRYATAALALSDRVAFYFLTWLFPYESRWGDRRARMARTAAGTFTLGTKTLAGLGPGNPAEWSRERLRRGWSCVTGDRRRAWRRETAEPWRGGRGTWGSRCGGGHGTAAKEIASVDATGAGGRIDSG